MQFAVFVFMLALSGRFVPVVEKVLLFRVEILNECFVLVLIVAQSGYVKSERVRFRLRKHSFRVLGVRVGGVG